MTSTETPSNTTAPTQYLAAGDNTYAYRRFGSGPGAPLLLLQHFTGTLDNWDPAVTDSLALGRPVVLFESPGIGRSGGKVPEMRQRLAQVARTELEQRKRAMMVMTYDDLVSRLGATLMGPGGTATAAQLRSRFDVVLVDEFQDTDPAQWEIMRLAFGAGPGDPVTLVLIADPKQAIYAFRGADVYAYLDAARTAGTTRPRCIHRRRVRRTGWQRRSAPHSQPSAALRAFPLAPGHRLPVCLSSDVRAH